VSGKVVWQKAYRAWRACLALKAKADLLTILNRKKGPGSVPHAAIYCKQAFRGTYGVFQ